MSFNFLDKTGLSYVINKIKSKLSPVALSGDYEDLSNLPVLASGNYYGTSTGQAALQNKAVVVSADQHFELKVGCIVAVKFDANNTYNATASAPVTMNVNNTGAKQIYYNNTPTQTGTQGICFGSANRYIYYMYDGTYWVWLNTSFETIYNTMSLSELLTGTATTQRVMDAQKTKAGIEALSTAYGTCSTEAATPEKIVTLVDSNWKLRIGATITVKFSNTNTATNPTLNVNNSGAKSIWYNSAILTKGWGAGSANVVTTFVYDGTYWVWIGHGVDSNTTYSAMSVSELTTGTATASRVVRADYLKQGIKEIIEDNTHQIPSGGTTGQVLKKKSNTDYDIEWGEGGTSSVTPSHVGQIIHSTTLNTLAKVQAIYGSNTTWISLSGYVLRGATSGVTPNNNVKDLGSDNHIITADELPSHRHSIPALSGTATSKGAHTHPYVTNHGSSGAAWCANLVYENNQTGGATELAGAHTHPVTTTASNTGYTGSGASMSIVPNEKNVYMWERIS